MKRTGMLIINIAAVVGGMCLIAGAVVWVLGIIANWNG